MIVSALGQCSLDHIALVERFPDEDAKQEVLGWTTQGGGPAATALVALARLDAKTFFMGRVSDDRAGQEIRTGLRAEGVDTRGLITKKHGTSQTAFIVVNKRSGTRTIFWQQPTVEQLAPDEVRPSLIKKSDLLLIDGLMHEASIRAVDIARKYGVLVMLDAGTLRKGTLDLIPLCDYVVGSEAFADKLSGSPEGALERLASFNPRAATVTLGKQGSLTWARGKTFSTPAHKVRVVDTTGAGDVFHGGYIYGVLKGWDLEKTVRFASVFAALKCLKVGGRAGIPTLSRTMQAMKG